VIVAVRGSIATSELPGTRVIRAAAGCSSPRLARTAAAAAAASSSSAAAPATSERRERAAAAARACGRMERGILAQDRLVPLAQRGTGLDAELVEQRPAGVVVGLERFGLAAAAV